MSAPDNPYAVSEATASQAEFPVDSSIAYAGFWRRAGAYVFDYLLVSFVTNLVSKALFPRDLPSPTVALASSLGFFVAVCLYYALLESSDAQSTYGKRALGIKVTDLNGEQISFGRALGRVFAHACSVLSLGAGFAMATFTERRQALHDKISGTLVVRRTETPRDIAQAGPAPRVPAWQATLIVLAFVSFFPITLLVARFYPLRETFRVQAQVSEGITVADPFRWAVERAAAAGRSFKSINSDTLDVSLPKYPVPRYVASIRVYRGAIEINYGIAADKHLVGGHLVLVPAVNAASHIVWICGHAMAPSGFTPVIRDYQQYTNIHERWLPPECTFQAGRQ